MRERERGQTFPWQDPRVPTEGRVQPLKERLRARQSISGLHLHNKWSSYSFSSPSHTSTHTTHECIHSALISTRQRKVIEKGREGEGERECVKERKRGRERERARGHLSAGVVLHKYYWLYQKHKQRHGEHGVTKSLQPNIAAAMQM